MLSSLIFVLLFVFFLRQALKLTRWVDLTGRRGPGDPHVYKRLTTPGFVFSSAHVRAPKREGPHARRCVRTTLVPFFRSHPPFLLLEECLN